MRLLFLVLALAFFSKSDAQEPIYKHYGVDEGLPSSQVYDIYQDKQGYIWFATDKGLSRYNGYEFENFDINDGLPGNVVLRFYPQANGDVCGYTYHNKVLFYFNKSFNGFTNYKHNELLNKALKLSSSIVKSVFVDDLNTVHLGGVSINGELRINEKGEIDHKYAHKNYFDENPPEKYTVLNNYSNKTGSYFITANKDIIKNGLSIKRSVSSFLGLSWLIPDKKVVFMDGRSTRIISSNKTIKIIETEHAALGIKGIDSTRFFVGYHFGGGKIITDKGKVIKEYLKDKSVTNFLIDQEGGYWFTTLNSGVYYIQNPLVSIFKQPNKNGFSHINSLVKKNDELLIGYENGDFGKIDANTILSKFKVVRKVRAVRAF